MDMANFLYVFRGDGMGRLSPQEMQKQMDRWRTWIEQLTKSGNFKAGEPLERNGKVVTGRKKLVTDGPYAESKDLVGGYLLVSAANLDEAVELSRGCPIFETDGSVEVRPIAQM
jgi:hypothetical protein